MKKEIPTPLIRIAEPVARELQDYRARFEATLRHDEPLLNEALSYICSREGKMMRPILVLLMAREAGGVNEKAQTAAIALEMLHTASLVHDDVVDESNLRRGLASVNQKYGNKMAVLLGDFLLSLLLCKAAETGDNRMVERIAQLGGTLAKGEITQLDSSRHKVPDETAYFRIIGHKTAALFATCAELGAMAAGGESHIVERAKRFGELVGICFQIRDDIFDFYDAENIGKPTGNDLFEGKFTLPVIHALNAAPCPTLQPIIEHVKTCKATREEVAVLVDFTKTHGGIDYARNIMDQYRKEAIALLDGFHDDAVREALSAYADYVAAREI